MLHNLPLMLDEKTGSVHPFPLIKRALKRLSEKCSRVPPEIAADEAV